VAPPLSLILTMTTRWRRTPSVVASRVVDHCWVKKGGGDCYITSLSFIIIMLIARIPILILINKKQTTFFFELKFCNVTTIGVCLKYVSIEK